jgi:aldose 1-epimerase
VPHLHTIASGTHSLDPITIQSERITARFIPWGATLISLEVPDRYGVQGEVTLGFNDPERYLEPHPFFGCVAGRYANRIAQGRFTLDGKVYTLATNDGRHHLHGGVQGFDKRDWSAAKLSPNAVRFSYVSAGGEEGYPGTLSVSVTYTLTEHDELRIDYTATSDAPTVVNLTHHAYWNLGPDPDILAHELQLNATKITVVDHESIPTGRLRDVAGTAFDFTTAKAIGRDIAAMANSPGGGFDHNWMITAKKDAEGFALAALLREPKSGRTMRVLTDQPGIQFYSGNYLNQVHGRRLYDKHAGLCLETQHFPDSPNHPEFPSTVLRPGETFRSTTIYAFSIEG